MNMLSVPEETCPLFETNAQIDVRTVARYRS